MSFKIHSLTIKNFLSVGNVSQALNFDKDMLTLILGENLDQGGGGAGGNRNGCGKSVIVNALSFALFGQALTNIKKDNLINNINGKNMLVSLSFEKNSIKYRIERGRKPNILKFFVNDKEKVFEEDESQGDMRETQKEINHLIGMTHDLFKHTVALNTYTEPFLSMRAADQRAIIEQLLGITLLSEKAEVLKEQIKTTSDLIIEETARIEATKKSNERIQQSISTLEMRRKAWETQRKADCEKLFQTIKQFQEVDINQEISNHQLLKEIREQSTKIRSLTKEKATLDTSLSHAIKTLQKYENELTALSDCKCPSCEQPLSSSKHTEMVELANSRVVEQKSYVNRLKDDIKKISDELEVIGSSLHEPETFYDSIEEAVHHQSNLKHFQDALESRQTEKDPYLEQIDDLKRTATQDIDWNTINELTSLKEHQQFLLKLLTNKDSFIRKKIIDQNLSYLNHRLSFYLDCLGLPHEIKFLNDLTVEIQQLGKDLDFDNLSRGERNRLIISLSLAFRDVWENLYNPINLLFVDELIDNGLDQAGVECALSVLKNLGRRNKNIFLISHRDELISRVNTILYAVKENGFTSFDAAAEVHEVK